ncbi:hypothetical protein [Microtetraspora malaysiensis]|uniref:hypothetical protein n=1 Tax=Microtetraspora malaysiensis TaxID=161358 RepID=UPI000834CADD|nr:hypothetical protein [Microtetraspora malaysiensis]
MSRTPPFDFKNEGYNFYRYPDPASYAFNRLLRDFRDPALRRRYLDDPQGLVAEYELSDAEAAALATLDVDTCVEAGAHPLLAWTGCRMTARDRDAAGS